MIEVMITALLVFSRLAGMMRVLPVLSMAGTPKLYLLLTGFAITVTILPIVPLAPLSTTMGVLLFGMAGEILVGILMGSIVLAIFTSMTLAGEIMANQMSLPSSMIGWGKLDTTTRKSVSSQAIMIGRGKVTTPFQNIS